MLEDGGVVGADVGEVPVEAAARNAHRFRQWLGLQRRETASRQRPEALVEPVLCGKLVGHPDPCDNLTIHNCIDRHQRLRHSYHTVMYGECIRCAMFCYSALASPRSR